MTRFLLLLTTASAAFAQTPAPKSKTANDYVAQLVATLTPTRKIVYKKVADRELSLHVFQPDGWKVGDKRACYITIHGGGWTGMGPERMFSFADHFAKLGLVSFSVEYRLVKAKENVTVFDCVKDVRSAVRYVRAHATELGIDPNKIIVSGGSAGGHLAAATAMFDVNEDSDDLKISPTPNALVLLFPVIDTSTDGYGNTRIGERWKELSPAHNVRPGLPPTITFHGTADPTTPFKGAQAFHDAMLKAGNRSELVVNQGGQHGYLMRTQPLYDECMEKTDAFLKSLKLLP
ncbi:MAG: alpha/beta hydrolase [Verrucomicrobiaceae bacterium]|nr:alpha/beta hydrolase [Verrucomicrobiaceae bacterium]